MRVRGRLAVAVAIVLAWPCGVTQSAAQGIRDGAALLTAMHQRHANNWYQTLTFQQDSITHNADGTDKTESWYEALMVPGKLRIDIGGPLSGNGMLVADGTLTRFQNNEITASRPFVHMLLVLGFDVYRQAPAVTIAQVQGEGFDLSNLHEDRFEGRPVYVVGGRQNRTLSKTCQAGAAHHGVEGRGHPRPY